MFDSCICVEPDDVVQLVSRKRRRARKEHRCGECGQTIAPGDVYDVDATVYEGEFTAYKTCLTCVRIRESLFKCGWYYGQLWADIHETFCDYNEEGELECVCPTSGGKK